MGMLYATEEAVRAVLGLRVLRGFPDIATRDRDLKVTRALGRLTGCLIAPGAMDQRLVAEEAMHVGPHGAGGVAGVEQVLELLTVVHRGAADSVAPHQLVPPIDADMILVAEVRTPMLLCPARVLAIILGEL